MPSVSRASSSTLLEGAESTKSKLKIFLVEDEPDLAELYHAALRSLGDFELASTAADAIEALQNRRKDPPHILLLDLIIPKDQHSALDFSRRYGFTVLETIRKLPEYHSMPVFVMTNIDDSEDRVRANQLGALDYIIKSNVVPKDIVERVYSVL